MCWSGKCQVSAEHIVAASFSRPLFDEVRLAPPQVYVIVDACGDVSKAAHQRALESWFRPAPALSLRYNTCWNCSVIGAD
jgi:hypothetical protein